MPSHLIPVVEMIRCPCTVTAWAPPLHSALTTDWMSCWWTTNRLRSTVAALMSSPGASERITVTPSPVSATSPASSLTARAWRRICSDWASWTLSVSRSTSADSSATCCCCALT